MTTSVLETKQLRPQRWGLWDVVITLASALVMAVTASVILGLIGASFATIVIVGSLASWVGLAGWPIIATVWRGNGPRIDLGLTLTWSDVRIGVLGGVAGILLAAIAVAITSAIVGDFTSAAGEAAELLIAQSSPPTWIIFGLLVMVGAPIAEELAFRGLMFGALLKRGIRPGWVIVITAAVFAVFHIEPTRMLVLFVIGLVLGYIRYRTRSVGAAMVAHGVNNAPAAIYVMLGMPEVTP
jgi:membrane protease YdiL (CAAX protease family)